MSPSFQTEEFSPSPTRHNDISPAILYWGTPVVLITTENPDGSPNIAPMSSAWWLGHGCMLGLAAFSQTTQNILRTKQCVLNLASDSMQDNVNAIAKTTGSDPVPEAKVRLDYRHTKDKFGLGKMTPMPSNLVAPPGIEECPVSMEAKVVGVHEMFHGKEYQGGVVAIEVEIVRISVHDDIRLAGYKNRIDTDKWRPMIMSFSELYGLRDGKLVHSRLAEIEEEKYRFLTDTGKQQEEEEEECNGSQLG